MQRMILAARKNPWQIVARFAATFLLAVISTDLADAACDPIQIPQVDSGQFAAAPEAQDPCADFCVPDCFACSTSVAAAEHFSLPRAVIVSQGPAESVESVVPGVSPGVDHIPITVT